MQCTYSIHTAENYLHKNQTLETNITPTLRTQVQFSFCFFRLKIHTLARLKKVQKKHWLRSCQICCHTSKCGPEEGTCNSTFNCCNHTNHQLFGPQPYNQPQWRNEPHCAAYQHIKRVRTHKHTKTSDTSVINLSHQPSQTQSVKESQE